MGGRSGCARRQILLDQTQQRKAPVVLVGERRCDAFQCLDALDQVIGLPALVRDSCHGISLSLPLPITYQFLGRDIIHRFFESDKTRPRLLPVAGSLCRHVFESVPALAGQIGTYDIGCPNTSAVWRAVMYTKFASCGTG
jgi:hypothetical protein